MGLPKEIAEFMAKYKVDADEIWKIPQGSAYAVKHKALERVATQEGITFDPPVILEGDGKGMCVAMLVTGRKGDRVEWSIGEASPHNYRISGKMAAYPWAMGEKRGKDRVVLKFADVHGSIYSEDELDEPSKQFGKGEGARKNPHVTRPEDVGPVCEYDAAGNPIDNIPKGDPGIERTTPYRDKNLRADYEAAQKEMRATQTEKQLVTWGERNKNRIASYPADWEAIFRGMYIEHRDLLRKEAA